MSRRLALIIGNSQFDDQRLNRLITPDQDVDALEAVLCDPKIGAFDQVDKLVNQPNSHVRKAISEFFYKRKHDDLLLLYYSGHGIRHENSGHLFLAARDTDKDHPRATSIGDGFIRDAMDSSQSKRQVLILDCCHSGAFSHGAKGVVGASAGTKTAFQARRGKGRAILTASDATQYAWEGDAILGKAENSVFTHYLVQGLKDGSADLDGNGVVTLDELYDYTFEQVIEATPKQTPSKFVDGQQGEIVIANNPRGAVIQPAELPADVRVAIDPTSAPWHREAVVGQLSRLLGSQEPGMSLAARLALEQLEKDDSRRVSKAAADVLRVWRSQSESLSHFESQLAGSAAQATKTPKETSKDPTVSQLRTASTTGPGEVKRGSKSQAGEELGISKRKNALLLGGGVVIGLVCGVLSESGSSEESFVAGVLAFLFLIAALVQLKVSKRIGLLSYGTSLLVVTVLMWIGIAEGSRRAAENAFGILALLLTSALLIGAHIVAERRKKERKLKADP